MQLLFCIAIFQNAYAFGYRDAASLKLKYEKWHLQIEVRNVNK